jgi:hypothetical protein
VLEEIYQPDMDVEGTVARLMKMSVQEVSLNEKKLIGDFPNTYTYTKNLAEKNLIKNRGHVKVNLLRPAIIASAFKEPYPGWTDTMSAAGGLTVLGGLGLMEHIQGTGKTPLDVIPVDIVSNNILLTTAHTA